MLNQLASGTVILEFFSYLNAGMNMFAKPVDVGLPKITWLIMLKGI